MIEKELTCKLICGIHARTAVELYQLLSRCNGACFLEYKDKKINCKSMIDIMKMNIKYGSRIKLIFKDDINADVLDRIEKFFEGAL